MLLVTTPRFEPRSAGVRAIVAGLQVRAAVQWAQYALRNTIYALLTVVLPLGDLFFLLDFSSIYSLFYSFQ